MHPLTLLLLAFLEDSVPLKGPEQPLPYSHKMHLSQGLKCKDCHENKDPGEAMGIPATTKCMACHTSIKKESPHIQKLVEMHSGKRPVPWIRVYQIPGYVYFSHRVHTDAGADCKTRRRAGAAWA